MIIVVMSLTNASGGGEFEGYGSFSDPMSHVSSWSRGASGRIVVWRTFHQHFGVPIKLVSGNAI
jgi:hypothetical protein